ncbi:acetyl-CoA carboxylase biotin carboxyl carrier protein [Reichenbachiella agariperforans]|uniref:Biotin carboxyl carrier protein of acetyl-CoA carboxylase n=1 Tax=Reichenbachiella agariperforans TaxID=156994 RepID=A0A1M6W0G5_REIAG|nr:acetyl-CoA carboxylase biotin carboxyl carrier protein [Reichenbachiella agariperforans]SHK87262.1 acetyl-CoA carboxylase biotin carboxyl carrier protein [Reichenbachiella agariperforans]
MKVKEIRDLIDFLSNSGLEEVNIETEEFKIKVKRSNETQIIEKSVASMPAAVAAPAPVAAALAPAAAPAAAPAPAPAANNYIEIKSPMIGTFYRSANPESPEFVSVGDKVDVGNPVCIIEAMKLFNEIESEVSGTIVKVLVENAQPVEYDQPLFLVDPS